MLIVKTYGGLGNQLFQYALYRKLHSLGKEVYIDNSWFDNKKYANRKYQLDVFKTAIKYCNDNQKYQLASDDRNIIKRLGIHLLGYKKSHYIENLNGVFEPHILEMDDVYLEGYWQRPQYFKDIREVLLQELVLRDGLDKNNLEMLMKINGCNAISVHVRRGDYLKADELYGGICTEEYYLASMQYMDKNIENPEYFIFSDDINWCKNFFGKKDNIHYVDINTEENGYYDLILMSKCKNNIIANSSFSWWAAWLNSYENKIVVSPSRWINGEKDQDIICKEWIKIILD